MLLVFNLNTGKSYKNNKNAFQQGFTVIFKMKFSLNGLLDKSHIKYWNLVEIKQINVSIDFIFRNPKGTDNNYE